MLGNRLRTHATIFSRDLPLRALVLITKLYPFFDTLLFLPISVILQVCRPSWPIYPFSLRSGFGAFVDHFPGATSANAADSVFLDPFRKYDFF